MRHHDAPDRPDLLRWVIPAAAVLGLSAAFAAGVVIWWVFTDPVSVGTTASTVAPGDGVLRVASAIGAIVLDAVRTLLRFL